jgi:hypothetical protein
MRITLFPLLSVVLVALPVSGSEFPPDLVKKLGDKSFKVRSDATAQLAKLGPTAIPALIEGSKHPDAEVAEQCRKLLLQAEEIEQKEKLDGLFREPTAPPLKGLAGAEQFFKVVGDSAASREVYVDLMRHHHKAMMLREKNPAAASDLFFEYGKEMSDRVQRILKTAKNKAEGMVFSSDEITLLFVFAADPRVNAARRHHVYQWMLVFHKNVGAALTEGDRAPVMRKLFVNWLFNEPIDLFQQTGFELLAELKMPDFLPHAIKLINDKGVPARTKAMAMISLRQLGSKEHVKMLTPYLTDKTEVHLANLGAVFRTQLRDVAMGMSIHLAGEKGEDYGMGDRRFGEGRGVPKCLYYYGFTDDKSRGLSHEKWAGFLSKGGAVPVDRTSRSTDAKDQEK